MHSIPWLTAFEIHAEKMQNRNLQRRGDVTGALSLSLSLSVHASRAKSSLRHLHGSTNKEFP